MRKHDFIARYEFSQHGLIAWLQVCALNFLHDLLDFGMAGCCRVKLASNLVDARDDSGPPLIDCDVNAELVRIFRFNGVDGIDCPIVVVELENGLNALLHDFRVAQLPNCEWAALNEALDPEKSTFMKELGAQAGLRHAPEERRLHILVNDFTLKLAIEELTRRLTVWWKQDIALQVHPIACVGHAVELGNLDVLRRLDSLRPTRDVLKYVGNYDLFSLTSCLHLLCGCAGLFLMNHF